MMPLEIKKENNGGENQQDEEVAQSTEKEVKEETNGLIETSSPDELKGPNIDLKTNRCSRRMPVVAFFMGMAFLLLTTSIGKLRRLGGRYYASSRLNLSELARTQVRSYQDGTGLMINVYISHHAGSNFCKVIGHAPDANGIAPPLACIGLNHDGSAPPNFPSNRPWAKNKTADNIALVREEGFHMLSWEFKEPPRTPLTETDWENPNLLSIIVMRHPLDRLLASDGSVSRHYPGLLNGDGTRDQWLEYSKSEYTNNYALHILAGQDCCQAEFTSVDHLETAKALVSRFSIVLDMECLNEGLVVLGKLIGVDVVPESFDTLKKSAKDRIGYNDVYEGLTRRNKLDIELYNWSKSRALVNCSALSAA